MENTERLNAMVNYLRSITEFKPEVGIVLGSGLGEYAEKIENPIFIPYNDIPNFPVSTVSGHAGRFVLGSLFGKRIIAMQGRIHYYEGYGAEESAVPVRVMKMLGCTHLILTNAAGGVNTSFSPGDLMLISDHINFSGTNPLIGVNDDNIGPRFTDLSEVYDLQLREKLTAVASENGIQLKTGVYMMFSGPSYETPAEIRMARTLGADAVGMSTVLEAIAARHCGLQVLGISCITNLAAGIQKTPLNHHEVIETAERVKNKFSLVIDLILEKLL